MLQEKAQPLFL